MTEEEPEANIPCTRYFLSSIVMQSNISFSYAYFKFQAHRRLRRHRQFPPFQSFCYSLKKLFHCKGTQFQAVNLRIDFIQNDVVMVTVNGDCDGCYGEVIYLAKALNIQTGT